MGKNVRIGNISVGDGDPCLVIAEIGINHNGDLDLAKQLIDASKEAGAGMVKFQKRTVDVVYSSEELARPRESPFGATNGDLKRGLEFGRDEYVEIDRYCKERDILWCASCWDEGSVDFMEQFNPPCYKIASACLTDDGLLRHHHKTGRPIILSTGMSTMEQIRHAVRVLDTDDLIILHCTSTYPSKPDELNLRVVRTLFKEFPNHPIGYSGHEVGLQTTVAAVALGAGLVERHITMDRAMWGSDQSASVEPQGFQRMVRDIRAVESAMGDGVKRVYEGERPIIAKLRRVGK
jgi:N-acetylneuraminate synthase